MLLALVWSPPSSASRCGAWNVGPQEWALTGYMADGAGSMEEVGRSHLLLVQHT